MKIMFRCARSNSVVYKEEGEEPDCWKDPLVYNVYEYYLVEFKGDRDNSVLERYCEPLLDDIRGPGSFICLGSFIYSIPLKLFCEYENVPLSLPYPNNGEMINRLTQMFVATIDKSQNPKKWTTSCAVPEYFYCASLSGVIYGLQSGNIQNALCFQPPENVWTPSDAPPPPELHGCGVTGNMIPDPINDRILVHLVGGTLTQPSLYAWHPKIVADNGEAWKLLEPFHSYLWYGGTTLININDQSLLIFFFNDSKDLFQVWSLEEHKFLEITWLNELPRLELLLVPASSITSGRTNFVWLCPSWPLMVIMLVLLLSLYSKLNNYQKVISKVKVKSPLVICLRILLLPSLSFLANRFKLRTLDMQWISRLLKFRGLFEVLSYEDDKWLQVHWSTTLPFYPKATMCYLGN